MARIGYTRNDDLKYEAVVILDEVSGDSMEFQRAFAFDDQDRESGMDTYCLVRGDATHYGGLASWSLAGDVLRLRLDQLAAAALELPRVVEIPVVADDLEPFHAHLARITSG